MICRLSKQTFIHGMTPVSNLFISEYLPGAPESFVKVYLYALMACYNGLDLELEDVARDLELEDQVVRNAFSYWENRGLLLFAGGCYEFIPIQTVVATTPGDKNGELNKYKDFNTQLSLVMGGRWLSPDDLLKAYDWLEIYGMDEDCVLTMVSYAIEDKYKSIGNKVSFSTLDKLARRWAELGIKTTQQAEAHVEQKQLSRSGAGTILKHLGIFGRNPSADEIKLFTKWTQDYGFSLEAIMKACSEMTYSSNPNFRLLDAILTKYYDKGAIKTEEVVQSREEENRKYQLYRDITTACGLKRSPTKPQIETIEGWLSAGMEEQSLLYVCETIAGQQGSFKKMDLLVQDLLGSKVTGENEVAEYLSKLEMPGKKKKDNPALHYQQRNEKQDMQSLFDNL